MAVVTVTVLVVVGTNVVTCLVKKMLVKKALQHDSFAQAQMGTRLTAVIMSTVLRTVLVLVLVDTGGVLTSRQEHALVTRAGFSTVPLGVQCSAKVGKTSARLSMPVVMVVV